jgi:hypothetical protein
MHYKPTRSLDCHLHSDRIAALKRMQRGDMSLAANELASFSDCQRTLNHDVYERRLRNPEGNMAARAVVANAWEANWNLCMPWVLCDCCRSHNCALLHSYDGNWWPTRKLRGRARERARQLLQKKIQLREREKKNIEERERALREYYNSSSSSDALPRAPNQGYHVDEHRNGTSTAAIPAAQARSVAAATEARALPLAARERRTRIGSLLRLWLPTRAVAATPVGRRLRRLPWIAGQGGPGN